MAFNKKTWEDNVSDLTAAELNRMEQGIYDNSLVVDAIKNKLNPTDTETYTTEEITEGQFENVLAVKNILLKGNTSQDGDPTPSSPKDIHVVTGYNTVDIDGTNIYDSSYRRANGSLLVINGSATEQDGNFVLRATAADVRIWQTINKDVAWNENAGKLYRFDEDLYRVFITNSSINSNYIVYYNKDRVSLGFTLFNSNNFIIKKSDKAGAEYFSLRCGNANSVAGDIYEFEVKMFSKNNSFPINLGTTELCKIGNYQDYFYKSGSKWYLHKEIGKSIFNGDESWLYSANNLAFYTDVLTLSQINSILFCNRFLKVNNSTTYANMNTGEIKYDGVNSRRIIIKYTDVTSATDFKTWLASNNTKVYYLLETATDTEITDTTLISQLNAIINSPLYEDTNIVQTNSDLPIILDITAYKDNIEGIKAWIRK